MTVFAETNVDVDLRMLRSFRVLRPLKLVSKIPSESESQSFCERGAATNGEHFLPEKKKQKTKKKQPVTNRTVRGSSETADD